MTAPSPIRLLVTAFSASLELVTTPGASWSDEVTMTAAVALPVSATKRASRAMSMAGDGRRGVLGMPD